MATARIEMVSQIYGACSAALNALLIDIPEEHYRWKPAPESRCICEIMAHTIRVNRFLLKKIGYDPEYIEMKNPSPEQMEKSLNAMHDYIADILHNLHDDEELLRNSSLEEAGSRDTIFDTVVHISQHYLYHTAQMIYLRRAKDRNWKSPSDLWEKATYVISDYLCA